jgi:hypothetical protein
MVQSEKVKNGRESKSVCKVEINNSFVFGRGESMPMSPDGSVYRSKRFTKTHTHTHAHVYVSGRKKIF